MRRYPSPQTISYSFGPGPLSTAMKALIAANVVLFILTELPGGRVLPSWLGLMPAAAITASNSRIPNGVSAGSRRT